MNIFYANKNRKNILNFMHEHAYKNIMYAKNSHFCLKVKDFLNKFDVFYNSLLSKEGINGILK